MSHIKKILLLVFVLFTSTQQTFTMQLATKITMPLLKEFAKKGFSKTMTGYHWLIAAGGSTISGLQRLKALSDEKKCLANYIDANEEVTNFIRSALEQTHDIKIDGVKVEPQHPQAHLFPAPFPEMGTFRKHIFMNHTTANEIDKALKAQDQETLNKWLGIINHEANHIDHEDVIQRAIVDLVTPFATHGSVKIIRNALPIAQKARPFLREQLMKIPTAHGKGFITTNVRNFIYRLQEQRADDCVSNDINKLKGLKNFFEDLDDYKISHQFPNPNLSPEQIKKICWALNFLEEHPLPMIRIEKLDRRIEILKQQEKHPELLDIDNNTQINS